MIDQMVEYSETVPIQYEIKNAEFMGMNVYVDERVLIPRPETELLIETVSNACETNELSNPMLLEIGVGSGIISIELSKQIKDASIVSVDISSDALEVARINIDKLLCSAENNIDLVQSDLFGSLTESKAKFDGIMSNPPYVSNKDYDKVDTWVKAEPEVALKAGEEGMDIIEKIIAQAKQYLKKDGFLALEIGYDQSAKTKALMAANGYTDIKLVKDFNDHERVIIAKK